MKRKRKRKKKKKLGEEKRRGEKEEVLELINVRVPIIFFLLTESDKIGRYTSRWCIINNKSHILIFWIFAAGQNNNRQMLI